MKRFWAATILLILLANVALAEPFELHNGVLFGMTKNEVEKIETAAGFELEYKEGCFIGNTDDSYCLWFSAPNLAGVGGQVYFDFSTKTKTVNLCEYVFSCSDSEWKNLIDAYRTKYGSTIAEGTTYVNIESEAHDAIDVLNEYFDSAESFNKENSPVSTQEYELNDFYQWLIMLDDGSAIDIMLCEIKNTTQFKNHALFGTGKLGPYYDRIVTYSLRTEQEVQSHWEAIQEVKKAREADI